MIKCLLICALVIGLTSTANRLTARPFDDPSFSQNRIPLSREKQEDDIRETVFRYQFKHNASALQHNAKVFFLALDNGSDPNDKFIERFKSNEPPVMKVSKSRVISKGVEDKRTGGAGLIFRVTTIKWITDDEVEVTGGYYEGTQSASGNLYRVVRDGTGWKVKTDSLRWSS